MALHKIATIQEIPVGEGRAFELEGRRIAVFHTEEGFLAIDDECTHQGGPLSEGFVEECCVTCPWHGAEFDLHSGRVLSQPANEDVRSYKVVVTDGELFLEIE